MFEFIKLIPLYLICLTVIFVIVPTLAAVCLRYSLYQHLTDSATKVTRLLTLDSRGQQPKIVDNLESRFREARGKLEQVNTIALIDGVYSQEKFTCFGRYLRCEQWDYFCQNLPNLLLAFGLLGTFLGITLNLSNISQTLGEASGDVNNLIAKLQTPLQSMGIAFITSLTAILCSSLLIIVNLRCNTNFAKSLLISSLEDYLDNIFQPNIKGASRIDLAIDRMVKQQEEFLNRFHEKVGQVLETTIGNAANKMVDANQNFHNNVDNLVSRFQDVSGSLALSTNSWQKSTSTLKEQIEIITKIVPQVEESSRKLENGSSIFQLAANKIEQSKFSENIENITSDLATTQKAFSQSTAFLGNRIIKITESHEQAVKLAEQFYNQLQQASEKLQYSALGFAEASQIIQQSDFADKLASATKELTVIPQQFSQSINYFNKAIEAYQNSAGAINNLVAQINLLNQNSTNLFERNEQNLEVHFNTLKQTSSQIEQSHDLLSKLVTDLTKHQAEMINVLKSIDLSSTNHEKKSLNNELIQKLANHLQQIVSDINKLTSTLETNSKIKCNFRICK